MARFRAPYSAAGMDDKNVTETLLADEAGIARAAAILQAGGLVAVPTETVYGLAVRADSAEAVARIYAAKGRPNFNPLIVHVRDGVHAREYAQLDGDAAMLADKEWPGPLTFVLPLRDDARLARAVTAGLPSVAMRAPDHPVMRELLARLDFPLAAPSANRSGFISPTRSEHVLASLDGRIDMVLDGGPSEKGLESTIMAVREDRSWAELRPGPVDLHELSREHFGTDCGSGDARVITGAGEGVEAPGQLASHYSPGKPIRLEASKAQADEFMIGFGEVEGNCSLSRSGDLNQAASRLYDCLHQAAASDQPKIAVAPLPGTMASRAIVDRLKRAAA